MNYKLLERKTEKQIIKLRPVIQTQAYASNWLAAV